MPVFVVASVFFGLIWCAVFGFTSYLKNETKKLESQWTFVKSECRLPDGRVVTWKTPQEASEGRQILHSLTFNDGQMRVYDYQGRDDAIPCITEWRPKTPEEK